MFEHLLHYMFESINLCVNLCVQIYKNIFTYEKEQQKINQGN